MVESAKKFLRKVPIPWDMQQLGPFIVYLAVS